LVKIDDAKKDFKSLKKVSIKGKGYQLAKIMVSGN
jgi:hypothetical protein